MPLRIAQGPVDPSALKDVAEQYLIFYSSIVDGKLWCPDCQDVEVLVKETFSSEDSPSALIVYVGDRAEWKSSSSVLRAEPWSLTGVPTIVRLRDGARLTESEVAGGLAEFVKGS
ncbi:putative eukaryotic protein of unknown function (DUF953) [Lyophyllum shimeji]|uniref:Thioredoxin domain-containing protein n=1 Tax=Lyophyllum shimeji TaxID=47721 RepID=A0A9P3UJW2_LYOSH|nr:putative eukaryotic protein of unknown function (DUF953) [Lyophyllum shimeji]